jgi:hypothetical protein
MSQTALKQTQCAKDKTISDAKKTCPIRNYTQRDLFVWTYMRHNCGPAGANTYYEALDKLYTTEDKYKAAATVYANTWGKKLRWSPKTIQQQINEKTKCVYAAYTAYNSIAKCLGMRTDASPTITPS